MKLTDYYQGNNDLFEGDRNILLRSLPAGLQATRAIITLVPVGPPAGILFEEVITFTNNQGDLGATKTEGSDFVEVDFHARRTLARVGGPRAFLTLQVDVGGTYIGIADDGTFIAPGKSELTVNPEDNSTLPGLTVTKFKLAGQGADVSSVTIRSVPTNVSVRLGQLPPFWTRLGELAVAETSPDFAAVLNAFLIDAPVENRYYTVPLVIHSDTLARLKATVQIDYVLEQSVLPPYLPEVALPYGFSTLPGMDESLTTVSLPRDAIPVSGKNSAQIRGEFQPTRIALGPVGEGPPPVLVVVSPACSLAQPFRSDVEIELTGIDLPLANTQPGLAGLNVAIQADADGKPFGDVLTQADVRVDKPLPSQSSWGGATLAAPFRVRPAVRYWLVLQSLVGDAYWNAAPNITAEPALQCSRDGGLSWRVATSPETPEPLAALFRLRNTPSRFSIPVQLQLGRGPNAVRRRLDEFAPLGRVEFNFDFSQTLGEYLAGPAALSPCGSGELLVNGSFDEPPHDDASLRLLGVENVMNQDPIVGQVNLSRGVDLSVERYITLSVGEQPPRRIDCAGANPARTRLEEIIDAINRAMGAGIASQNGTELAGRLYLSAYPNTVTVHHWCRAAVPAGWQGLPGRVVRVRARERTIVALAAMAVDLACFGSVSPTLDRSEPAELAQQVPIVGGCTYLLRLLYQVFSPSEDEGGVTTTPARWQIEWFDDTGQSLGADGTPLERRRGEESLLSEYEAQVTAPAPATRAELSFSQPPSGILILDHVSLMPTLETLSNPMFRFWQDVIGKQNEPGVVGWTIGGGWIERGGSFIRLRGTGLDGSALPEDSNLKQVVTVLAGETYELNVQALPAPPPSGDPEMRPIQQRARLELRWLGKTSLGVPVVLPLDGRNFLTHRRTETAPAGATHAEIQLIQPRGQSDLMVRLVSLARVDRVEVPLIFLAEAPGNLVISGLRVTYDLPEPLAFVQQGRNSLVAQVRSAPLDRFEPAHAAESPVSPPPAVVPSSPLAEIFGLGVAGRLAAIGIDSIEELAAATPPDVAEALGGITVDHAASFVAEARRLLELEEVTTDESELPPLTAISGIGERRARLLADAGIDSIIKLAVAVPEDVAGMLAGVSVETATGFIDQAKQLLAPPDEPDS